MVNVKFFTLEGNTSFENYSDINMINSFSQEIITDGEIENMTTTNIDYFASDRNKLLKKVSEKNKGGNVKVKRHDFDIKHANYIIKFYYESLGEYNYLGELKDIEIYMENPRNKELLKEIKNIINYKITKKSSDHYIEHKIMNGMNTRPLSYVRKKVKKIGGIENE